MRFLAVPFLLLLGLLPSTLSADMTATFGGPGARDTAKVEIAANGDLRWTHGGEGYFLTHDGVDYIVLPGPGGPLVMRYADYYAEIAPDDPVERRVERHLVADGPVTVNGRSGTALFIRPAATPNWPAMLVIDSDKALAPLAQAEARIFAMQGFGGLSATLNTEIRQALAGGASLRFLNRELRAVSTDPIPAERFALPAEPLPPATRPAAGKGEARPSADDAFKRAVFARGQLWVLTDSGKLRTIAESGTTSNVTALPGAPVDMCVRDGAPVVLGVADGQWTAYRGAANGWTPLGTVATGGDGFVALNCTQDRMTLVTSKRLITLSDGVAHAVTLSEPLTRAVMATTFDAGDAILLGLDAGEWGGGLRRIARADGKVSILSRRPGGDGCNGPLSADCDPVNGIAPAPGKPGCVVVAIGLVHFMPHGRLTEVCGNTIARLYFKPYTIEQHWRYEPAAAEPFETVPFYGLVEADNALWAVGIDGLYRIGTDGSFVFSKLPPFRDIGGMSVSFALPHLVLVRTSINQRVAM
ncbi:MAG: hypothetical protein ABIS14_08570, partial [Sphingomonas sp.]